MRLDEILIVTIYINIITNINSQYYSQYYKEIKFNKSCKLCVPKYHNSLQKLSKKLKEIESLFLTAIKSYKIAINKQNEIDVLNNNSL